MKWYCRSTYFLECFSLNTEVLASCIMGTSCKYDNDNIYSLMGPSNMMLTGVGQYIRYLSLKSVNYRTLGSNSLLWDILL